MSVAGAILARPEVLSFWRLGESASPYADDVGSVTGTEVFAGLTEGQTSIVPGTSETSILFPHSGAAIEFAGTGTYDFTGSTTFTAYCWIRPIAYDGTNGHYLWSNFDGAVRGWSLFAGNPPITWIMSRGDNAGFDTVQYTGMSEAVYENGVPKQIAMSYDGTNLILNIDGVDVQSGASSKSLVAPTTNTLLNFGRYSGGGSSFDGDIQYAAIFSPNLVAADLLDIFNGVEPAAGRRIFKRLFGPAHLGTSAADLYTVPTGVRTTVRRIYASNPSGSPVDFTFSIGTDAASTRLYTSEDIPAGGELEEARDHTLEAGEKIQAYAGSGSTVVLIVDGNEESL